MTERDARDGGASAVLGAILVVLGLAFLGGQLLEDSFGSSAWPLYVIAPGAALLAVGLLRGDSSSGLTIAGTIVSTVGLLLLYQQLTGNWESWAYAWALVGPGASGLGILLAGARSGNRRLVRDGSIALLTGLALFAVGYLFFEGVIGLSGARLDVPEWLMPLLLIGLGAAALVRAILAGRRDDSSTPT